jgi:branched-chain amino acid transport system ATP-binding protein
MMLEVESLSVSYGDLVAVKEASFQVDNNQVVSLVGSNGAGKTTLIRALSGLNRLTSGTVLFEGRRIDRMKPHEIVEQGLIQTPEGRWLFSEMTVRENLEMGAYSSRSRGVLKETMEEVFSLFPVLNKRENQISGTLSGGEQQMLAIGRSLMAKPKLLILDEPSLGLAPIIVEEIFKVVETIKSQNTSILLVEQNVFHSLSISEMAYVIENGKIVMSGPGPDILQDDRIKEAYLGL